MQFRTPLSYIMRERLSYIMRERLSYIMRERLSYIMRECLSYPKECVSVSLIFEFSHIFWEIQECVSVIILRKR